MFDQLKDVWKCFIWGIFLLPALAETPSLPPILSDEDFHNVTRVTEIEKKEVLQTKVLSYEKEGRTLELVGVVHLGDSSYYTLLNERLTTYDAVFYEMIGKGKPPKPRAKAEKSSRKKGSEAKNATSPIEVVSQMYSLYTHLLNLELQMECINYHQPHFIHADMTRREFAETQAEKNETVMDIAFQHSNLMESVDQAEMLAAMITGDATSLKKSFIQILGQSDEIFAKKNDTSVLIGLRNQKCLDIMTEELRKNEKRKNVAIFYGAAHLPDFDQKLTSAGWTRTQSQWLDAWKVE